MIITTLSQKHAKAQALPNISEIHLQANVLLAFSIATYEVLISFINIQTIFLKRTPSQFKTNKVILK